MDIPTRLAFEYGNSLQAGQTLGGKRILRCKTGAEALQLGFANKVVVEYTLSDDGRGGLAWVLDK